MVSACLSERSTEAKDHHDREMGQLLDINVN